MLSQSYVQCIGVRSVGQVAERGSLEGGDQDLEGENLNGKGV